MSQSKILILPFLLIVCLTTFLYGTVAFTENIDPNNLGLKYAYGENIGWINFKPSQGPGVMVTALAVTGFAWGENIGWINLSPANGGVLNDGNGGLTGYAWGENVGWINFAPAGGGVFIDQHGVFFGEAWGENIGWISFNSTGSVYFGVMTSWKGRIPQISVIPTAYDFGNVKVKRSKTVSFKVTNKGNIDLTISTSNTGPDASMFTISGGGSKTVKPGKTLTIKVAFKPVSKGSKSAILEITSNDPVTPTVDISLSGTGQ